ncbi:NUDIX hydrolase [Streptomyces sp. F63]|uniref:NUDIX domain-containing protein n=1 Tax=Streptomyces sp. F63 TaxID=2824887 RepID=UPI001B39551F|nr:NUDIX hydrolase [Streptomyces sp. F63]MBQ0987906.1 NUDIX hydrolase [Streptomyces sp. F63]
MTTTDTSGTETADDYAAYIAGLPKVLAGAAALFRDSRGHVLVVEPNYRDDDRWIFPGGTVESDLGETPRQGARRETAEEIGLDVELGTLLAVDWVPGAGRPPIVSYLYDGGVLDEQQLAAIRLQEEELTAWRLVHPDELGRYLSPDMDRRVRAALAARAAGRCPVELEHGRVPGSTTVN